MRLLATRVMLPTLAAAFAGLCCNGCTAAAWAPQVTELVSPAAGPASGEPQLTAFGGRPLLSWIDRDGETASLKFAERTSSGWSAPRTVASGRDWFVNWADVPSVVRLGDGRLAAHWLQKSAGDTYAYDVRLSFSSDDGGSWSPSVTPHHDGTPNEHGFASLFPVAGGGIGLVWLDGREMTSEGGGAEPSGNMTLRAATFGPDGRQLSETRVADRVCECCPTAAVATGEGIVAAFRNRTKEEVRDIHVSRFDGARWSAPQPVHDDGWRIDACPVNGPALAADDRRVVVAWFNAKVDQGHAFVAFSDDAAHTFDDPIRVDDAASLGRVDVELLADGSAVVGWIEFADQRAQFRIRRVTRSGSRSEATTISSIASGRASGYPRIVRAGRELLFAWTETGGGRSRVRTAVTEITEAK